MADEVRLDELFEQPGLEIPEELKKTGFPLVDALATKPTPDKQSKDVKPANE